MGTWKGTFYLISNQIVAIDVLDKVQICKAILWMSIKMNSSCSDSVTTNGWIITVKALSKTYTLFYVLIHIEERIVLSNESELELFSFEFDVRLFMLRAFLSRRLVNSKRSSVLKENSDWLAVFFRNFEMSLLSFEASIMDFMEHPQSLISILWRTSLGMHISLRFLRPGCPPSKSSTV